jgi:Uma2 family endonuclease
MARQPKPANGPVQADQIRPGEYYELARGQLFVSEPAGRDHTGPNVSGAEVLDTDPDVEWSGVDPGYSPDPGTLWAPDVAVGKPVAGGGGWIDGVPQLALEYAGAGQDEQKLRLKIDDLLESGTRYVWVVRLLGPRRVEVWEPGKPMQTVAAGEQLQAPGVLRNPVPVEALYERRAAHQVALRNLLQRQGYESLEAVKEMSREEGKALGMATSILAILESRGLDTADEVRDQVLSCRDCQCLQGWLLRTATVDSAAEILSE